MRADGTPDAYRLRRRRAALILAAAAAVSTLPFILLRGKRLDTDMNALLPDDPAIAAEFAFLRDSAAGSTVAVSITADSAENAERLPEIVSEFSERAVAASSLIKKVVFRPDTAACVDAVANILARYPQSTTAGDLAGIERRLAPDAVAKALSQRRNELLRPGGLFKKKMVASDPLGLRDAAAAKIERALTAGGFQVVPSGGGLMSRDGRSALALVEVDAAPTDSKKAKEIYAAIDAALARSVPPEGFGTLVVSAHRHAIDNERLLKRDIRVTMIAAAIGFLLLFLLFFRSWRAVFVFATPVLGMLCAVGASWLAFPRPSAVILGLGATVIGISLDYGIHVFVAANGKRDPFAAARRVSRPLVFSALTTLGVFWAFFLSSTPGYHQLAFASTVGISASLLLSLTCLPLLLGTRDGGDGKRNPPILLPALPKNAFKPAPPRETALALAGAAVVATACLAAAGRAGFDMDVRKLDGAGKRLLRDEKAFHSIWGGSTPAAAVARADSFERAMEIQDDFAEFAAGEKLPGFQSLSLVWPSRATRIENAARWDAFWRKRESELKENIRKTGADLSFSPDAFNPFFERLHKHDFSDPFTKERGFRLLAARFLGRRSGGGGAMVSAFFDDAPEAVAKVREFARGNKGFRIVSPRLFGERVSRAVLSDALRAAAAAAALVLLLAWLCLKRFRSVVLALLPVLFGTLAIFPIHALTGASLNAMALVAAIVVAGLAIDYGIFAVTALERNDSGFSSDAFSALTLSMLTTLAGAGALLWAEHPALKTVGLVVCSGVAAAYLAAILLLPAAATALRLPTGEANAGGKGN